MAAVLAAAHRMSEPLRKVRRLLRHFSPAVAREEGATRIAQYVAEQDMEQDGTSWRLDVTSELAPWLELADQVEATRAEAAREAAGAMPPTPEGCSHFDMVGFAILADDSEQLRSLLPSATLANATDANGRTALWWACSLGKCACVRSLLAAGANPKIGPSALAVCSNAMYNTYGSANAKGGVTCAELLLEAGVPIEPEFMIRLCDCDDCLPLIELLSSHGAPREVANGFETLTAEGTARHSDTVGGALHVLAWLEYSRDWSTALHHVECISAERARRLLRAGAYLDARATPAGRTPVQVARELLEDPYLTGPGWEPTFATARVVLLYARLRRWRRIAKVIGRILTLHRRAAERVYAPTGEGFVECQRSFTRAAKN